MTAPPPLYSVVVPTSGRPGLTRLLESLGASTGPRPQRVVVVDDRRAESGSLVAEPPPPLRPLMIEVRSSGRGPAAARNTGWRATTTGWVVFLDDDVVVPDDWAVRLAADLANAGPSIGAVQGGIRVPLPPHRPPTDWERNVGALQKARWATADMAYRRTGLAEVGGFDERFTGAYREDADAGVRLTAAGYRIARGARHVVHPVGPASRFVSVSLQRNNAADALMSALHGPGWRAAAGIPRGRRPRHLGIALSLAAMVAGVASGRRWMAGPAVAIYALGTAELAWARIAPGPRSAPEIATMATTSMFLPTAAALHWAAGLVATAPLRVRRRLGSRSA